MPATRRKPPPVHDSSASSKPSRSRQDARRVRFGGSDGTDVDQEQDDDDADVDGQASRVTMAVAMGKDRLGVAYFCSSNATLSVTEDIPRSPGNDASGRDLVCLLVEQAEPDVVLLSSKADEALFEAVQSTLATLAASSSPRSRTHRSNAPKIQVRPSREFSEVAGQASLAGLEHVIRKALTHEDDTEGIIPDQSDGDRGGHGFGGRRPRLAEEGKVATITAHSLIDSDASSITLSAVSCLFSYLARTRMGSEGGRWEEGAEVRTVELVTFSQFMHLPQSTLAALSIFSTETHASLHSTKTSEGLSLFGILDSCRTIQGRQLLKTWLQRPSRDKGVIQRRQEAIACLRRNENGFATESLQAQLKPTHNLLRTVRTIEAGKDRVRDWKKLLDALQAVILIGQQVSDLAGADQVELFSHVAASFDVEEVRSLGSTVTAIVDFDESKIQGGTRVCVKPGVDQELDDVKARLENLEPILDRVASMIGTEVPPELAASFTVCYFPQLGYLCAVGVDAGWDARSVHDQAGWELQFRTEEQAYFKTDRMRELDKHLGDLQVSIVDREIEIINALQDEVRKLDDYFVAVSKSLAELDCIVSLAEVAKNGDWVRPTISDENVIRIKQGRHPLVEACVEVFIRNDTSLMGGRGLGEVEWPRADEGVLLPADLSVLVVTGANFSGKSAYLKQVALLLVLCQVGSFVPAEAMTFGIHDAVLTRVATRESVARGESAFMIDLQQVSHMLRNATDRSLLLIDEFGKGTDAADGQGLFCGVVRHLIERGAKCPTTLVATHFHAVFSNDLIPPSLPIGFAHMQVVLADGPSSHQADSSCTYLYRLAPGLCRDSHALACAAVFGIPLHVRNRAAHVSDLLARFEVVELIDVGMDEEEERGMKSAEDLVRRFVGAELDQLGEDGEEAREWLGRLIVGE